MFVLLEDVCTYRPLIQKGYKGSQKCNMFLVPQISKCHIFLNNSIDWHCKCRCHHFPFFHLSVLPFFFICICDGIQFYPNGWQYIGSWVINIKYRTFEDIGEEEKWDLWVRKGAGTVCLTVGRTLKGFIK